MEGQCEDSLTHHVRMDCGNRDHSLKADGTIALCASLVVSQNLHGDQRSAPARYIGEWKLSEREGTEKLGIAQKLPVFPRESGRRLTFKDFSERANAQAGTHVEVRATRVVTPNSREELCFAVGRRQQIMTLLAWQLNCHWLVEPPQHDSDKYTNYESLCVHLFKLLKAAPAMLADGPPRLASTAELLVQP